VVSFSGEVFFPSSAAPVVWSAGDGVNCECVNICCLVLVHDIVAVDRLSSQDDGNARATKSRLTADISVVRSTAESHRL